MVRGKTGRKYTFFLGKEAIEAIKEYKPNLKEDEYVFSKVRSNAPLSSQEFDNFVKRVAVNACLDKSYFMPHRFRHFFKSTLAGQMETTFIEFLMGHKLPGIESSYFLFNKDKMIESYLKNQHLLSVYNDSETLQKELDELKQKDQFEIEMVKGENQDLKSQMQAQNDKIASLTARFEKYFIDNEKAEDLINGKV